MNKNSLSDLLVTSKIGSQTIVYNGDPYANSVSNLRITSKSTEKELYNSFHPKISEIIKNPDTYGLTTNEREFILKKYLEAQDCIVQWDDYESAYRLIKEIIELHPALI